MMDEWMDEDQRSRIPCAVPPLSASASASSSASACVIRRLQATGWLAQ